MTSYVEPSIPQPPKEEIITPVAPVQPTPVVPPTPPEVQPIPVQVPVQVPVQTAPKVDNTAANFFNSNASMHSGDG